MATYNQGNIIIKTRGSNISKSGIKFLDKEGNETGLSLFQASNENTFVLGFTKKSNVYYKNGEFQSKSLEDNKDNIKDILVLSRQIALDLDKNVIAHNEIAKAYHIVNFIQFNDTFMPMKDDELKLLKETTNKSGIINVSNAKEARALYYYNKSIISLGFDELHIPKDTYLDFIEKETNISKKPSIRIIENGHRMKEVKLKQPENDYSKLDMTALTNIPKITIPDIINDVVLPPKMSEKSYLNLVNQRGLSFVKEDVLIKLIEDNVNFKYRFNRPNTMSSENISVCKYIEQNLERDADIKIKRISDFIDVLNKLEKHNINPDTIFPDLKDGTELKFIRDHKDEILDHLLIEGYIEPKKKEIGVEV